MFLSETKEGLGICLDDELDSNNTVSEYGNFDKEKKKYTLENFWNKINDDKVLDSFKAEYLTYIASYVDSGKFTFEDLGIDENEFKSKKIDVAKGLLENVRITFSYEECMFLYVMVTEGNLHKQIGTTAEEMNALVKEARRILVMGIKQDEEERREEDSLTHRITHMWSDMKKEEQ